MRKLSSKFATKYISEAGSKKKNKNYFGFVELDEFACWAIAESYDQDNNVISAQLAVDTVLDIFTKNPTLSKKKLRAYVKEAHRQLKLQSNAFQLKASILIVASNYKKMRYALCGNCKLHIFRGNNIFLRSEDQTLYQHKINQKEIPDDGEHGIEESQNLFDYLGKQSFIHVYTSKKILFQDEDILLLTTWGFWEKVNTIEMLDTLENVKKPLEYLEELQDLFLSKQEKNVNNYTLATVFANKVFQEKNNTKKIIKIVLMITIPLLIISIILFIYAYSANKKRKQLITTISSYEQQGNIYIEDENYDRALLEYTNGIKESKALKETKGKKGQENKEIKDKLTTKQRVTQLILDGDSLFEEGKYASAKSNYEKALKEAKYDLDFYENLDSNEIIDKISKCDDYTYTEELVALADSQVELEQYDKALKNYDEAKKIANQTKNKAMEKEIKLKIDTIESELEAEQATKADMKKEEEQATLDEKVKVGELMVLDGDKAVTEEKYPLAMEYYNKAINIYKETGVLDKASATEKKILEINEKIKQQEVEAQIIIAEGYIQLGEDCMLENKFEEALQHYKAGRDLYKSLKLPDEVVKVNEKISIVNTNLKEKDSLTKNLEIGSTEAEGDELLKSENYSKAKEKYRQAQVLYQSNNQMDKVVALEEKIKSIEIIEEEKKLEEEKEEKEELEKKEEESKEKEKIAVQEKEKMIYRAQIQEVYAEEAFRNKDYPLAITYYKQAINIYKSVGAEDKAEETKKKLLEVETSI